MATEHETATSAWVEVEENGKPVLCMDTERGRTVTFELSPTAAGSLRREFIDGPTVRHDLEDSDVPE